ncbi:MAG: hypothetical protein GXP55_12680 [Deltaproteobacteria bacterium]|nr:hypothetical protein [Deltaproteobacteria bacterium]
MLLVAAASGCALSHTIDADAHVGVDVGFDSGLDSGREVGVDAAPTTDASVDAAPPSDAGSDAGPTMDAAICSPVELLHPGACTSGRRPEGSPSDGAGLFFAIDTPTGPLWLRDDDLDSTTGGAYSIVRPTADFESFTRVAPLRGIPFVHDGTRSGGIVDASAYNADCDRWLLLVQAVQFGSIVTFAAVATADGHLVGPPVEVSTDWSTGPVLVTPDGFDIVAHMSGGSRPGPATLRRVEIALDGTLRRATATVTTSQSHVIGWSGTTAVLETLPAACSVPMLRCLVLRDLTEDGALVHARSNSALGEDDVYRWQWILPPDGPAIVVYVAPTVAEVRAQQVDLATGLPLGPPFTVFRSAAGSWPNITWSQGTSVPGGGALFPVDDVGDVSATMWLASFDIANARAEQWPLGEGVNASPAPAIVRPMGDRYVAWWQLTSPQFDEVSCRP